MIGCRTKRAGFTLFELMLTVSLVAIVLVETGIVFRAGSRGYQRSHHRGAAVATAEDALWLITRDVEAVACPTDLARPPVKAAATGLLRLRTSGGRGSDVVDYFLYVDDDGRQSLVRRSEPINDGPQQGPASPPVWEVLAPDVAQFALRFFDGHTWTDAWTPTADAPVPRLIEITLTVPTADGREVTRVRIAPVTVQSPLSADPGATP